MRSYGRLGRIGAKFISARHYPVTWGGVWKPTPVVAWPLFRDIRRYSTAETRTEGAEGAQTEGSTPTDTTENQESEEPKTAEEEQPKQDTPSAEDLSPEELLAEYRSLKESHGKLEEEAKDLKSKLAYALAEIENVRKISRKDITNAREFALKGFGKDLLDVVDNCERALDIFPEECKEKGHQMSGIYTGLEMTANVMFKVLEKHGLSKMPIEPKETTFDPNMHDALFQQPVEGLDSGIIFATVKTGWTINGRVLRAAQVGVSSDAE